MKNQAVSLSIAFITRVNYESNENRRSTDKSKGLKFIYT